MVTHLLLDCTSKNNDKEWIERELTAKGVKIAVSYPDKTLSELVRSGQLIRGYYLQIVQVIKVLLKAKKNEPIICWYSVTGIILNALSRICGNHHELVLLNWLTPPSKVRRVDKLYRFALSNPKVKILINLQETEFQWRKHLGVTLQQSARFFHNPDVYDDSESFHNPIWHDNKYVFIGGMTNRNWKLVNEIATRMPNVSFVCCALKPDFERQVFDKASNIIIHYNIPFEEYYTLMLGSSLSLIPLKDKSVSGLVTILKTIQFGIPCIVSDYPATRQYFINGFEDYCLCKGPVEKWISSISNILNMDRYEYVSLVEKLQSNIKKSFSPVSSVNIILQALK